MRVQVPALRPPLLAAASHLAQRTQNAALQHLAVIPGRTLKKSGMRSSQPRLRARDLLDEAERGDVKP
jgi:hypothetical protein